jgi:ABC-type branched-subunit amino acid transport system permease subunit
MKKVMIQFIQHLAASVFIGIGAYGAIIYWGGEAQKKIPTAESLLLGLGAVVCVIVVVAIGGLLDRMAGSDEDNGTSMRREDD